MKKREHLNKKENNSDYTQMRRNHMLSLGFCSECSNFNDRFPMSCCSKCSHNKKLRRVYPDGK